MAQLTVYPKICDNYVEEERVGESLHTGQAKLQTYCYDSGRSANFISGQKRKKKN
jgi:hypothetical protein